MKPLTQEELQLLVVKTGELMSVVDMPLAKLIDDHRDRYEKTDPESVLITYLVMVFSFMMAKQFTISSAVKTIEAQQKTRNKISAMSTNDYIASVLKDAQNAAVKKQGG